MAKATSKLGTRPNDEIRQIMLKYFYERNRNATSAKGKKGSAVKISNIKAELKAKHGLKQQEVQSNLTYLLSQGWVEEKVVEKQVKARDGIVIPSVTSYYQITAAGIDKIEGPGEFTMPKFHGINIQATGQNIITLGDGNQVNASYSELGNALVELRKAITQSASSEKGKMALVADIETIQSQLAKPAPNKEIIRIAWETVKTAAAIDGCAGLVEKAAVFISKLFA